MKKDFLFPLTLFFVFFCSSIIVLLFAANIYESVVIMAKRANQISATVKQELSQKLEEFSSYADTLEETFENREQIEISKHYERLPKPTLVAIDEFQHNEIYHRKVETQK